MNIYEITKFAGAHTATAIATNKATALKIAESAKEEIDTTEVWVKTWKTRKDTDGYCIQTENFCYYDKTGTYTD